MDFGPDKVMVVEADERLRNHLVGIITAAGHTVSGYSAATLKNVLEFMPDVIVMGANPPQLDCCDLLGDVKGSEQTRPIRVIMLASGGAAERIRGLELGGDDVLSLPFEDRELLARIRAQFREKRPEDELRESVRSAKRSGRQSRRVLHALNEGRRLLRFGFLVLATLALCGIGIISFLYWRSQKQNVRVYSALAKLQTGVIGERDLIELARRSKTDAEANVNNATQAQQQILKQKNQELRQKIVSAEPAQVGELEKQLRVSNERLHKLESESTVAQEVIRSYASSVCLLHVAVGFRDKASHLTLRYTTLTPPDPSSAALGQDAQLQIGGIGAEVRMDAFGTGFLVSSDGRIVTNHHVVEPWWKDDRLGELLKQAPGIEPIVAEMTAYFPGVARGIPVSLQKISSEADVALVNGNVSGLRLKLLSMDDDPKAAVSGEPVVLIGYPTAIDAILARSSEDTLRSIAAKVNGDVTSLMTELARHELIRPVNTQGHIGDILNDKIIYDAQTTSGGSGGPLFNSAGKVIAVNVAMLRDFGGSNFAIPIRYAKRMLTQ